MNFYKINDDALVNLDHIESLVCINKEEDYAQKYWLLFNTRNKKYIKKFFTENNRDAEFGYLFGLGVLDLEE